MTEANEVALTQLLGHYNLRITLSNLERNLIVDPSSIHELSITQSIHSFLPSLRLIIPSAGEEYIHVVPLDKTDRISIDVGYDTDIFEGGNGFDFRVYRRFPTSSQQLLDVEALLDVSNLFDKRHIRGFNGSVKNTVEKIASGFELYAAMRTEGQRRVETRISDTLEYDKNIVQCNQTNAELLRYFVDRLEGKDGEGAFYCFFYNENGKTHFSFKTLKEHLQEPIKYYFCYGSAMFSEKQDNAPSEMYFPVWGYEIVDNYKLEGLEGLGKRTYRYFDYEEGHIEEDSLELNDVPSISRKFSVPDGEEAGGPSRFSLGRSNSFTKTFKGKAKNQYYKSLMNLERIRVTTYGIPNAAPGQLVQLFFAAPYAPEEQMNFQYQGVWMIESVQHSATMLLTSTFILIRSGVDSPSDYSNLTDTSKRSVR